MVPAEVLIVAAGFGIRCHVRGSRCGNLSSPAMLGHDGACFVLMIFRLGESHTVTLTRTSTSVQTYRQIPILNMVALRTCRTSSECLTFWMWTWEAMALLWQLVMVGPGTQQRGTAKTGNVCQILEQCHMPTVPAGNIRFLLWKDFLGQLIVLMSL